MAEQIKSLTVECNGAELPHPIRYVVRYSTTGSGRKAKTKSFVVIFVTDLFKVMGYANPSKSASAMLNRGRSEQIRSATSRNVNYNVITIENAIPLILSCTRDVPAIKVALVDALRVLAGSVEDADI